MSGLTLAHMLNAASISFTLLEARDVINPSVGASIVVMPNGARILDQLGVYDTMWDEFLYAMKRAYIRKGEDGSLMGDADWPRLVEERYVTLFPLCVWGFGVFKGDLLRNGEWG